MADQKRDKAELKRYFVKLTPEVKRRLDHLAVDAEAASTEEFAGRLLTQSVNRLWRTFNPKHPK